MFEGFNDSTIKYFELMEFQNDKQSFKDNYVLYEEGIKQPLEQLYFELSNYFSALDFDITVNKRRSISSPYNDARFCVGRPMKEYIYIRFKVNHLKKENTIGFFFDASMSNYKYGLNIYNLNSHGMELIREVILGNKKKAETLIRKFDERQTIQLVGKPYARDHYSNEKKILRNWLNMRTMSFMHKEEMNSVFFERTLLENMLSEYEEMKEIYFFLKDALK